MKKFIAFVFIIASVSGMIFAQEEDIFIEETGQLLKYTFSNDLKEIEKAISSRTARNISLDGADWQLNLQLSNNVKSAMTKHNTNYSMTTYVSTIMPEMVIRIIIVNRRSGDRWFIASWQYYEE